MNTSEKSSPNRRISQGDRPNPREITWTGPPDGPHVGYLTENIGGILIIRGIRKQILYLIREANPGSLPNGGVLMKRSFKKVWRF